MTIRAGRQKNLATPLEGNVRYGGRKTARGRRKGVNSQDAFCVPCKGTRFPRLRTNQGSCADFEKMRASLSGNKTDF